MYNSVIFITRRLYNSVFIICQIFLQKVKEVVLNIEFFYLVTGKVYHCTLTLPFRLLIQRSKEATTKFLKGTSTLQNRILVKSTY